MLPRHHCTRLNLIDFQFPRDLLDYRLTETDLEHAIFMLGANRCVRVFPCGNTGRPGQGLVTTIWGMENKG